ncbi:DsbA family protein [Legionella birminghamensis]|uniref:DsbA family protein n=1 Tax=Legionella birminghamensis TaxID=28083 RepID=UPI0007308DF9|nr:DsbA family protein [Legionella birminghamensis]
MKFSGLLTAGALITAMFSPIAMADSTTAAGTNAAASMPDAQKKAIEQVIHDYLVNNPEVLIEASQALQQKQQQSMQQQAQSAIQTNANDLFSDKLTVLGNPNGNVTLVEFFDYQCIHCKKMAPIVGGLIQKDPNLRVIYKEFPIFGKSSEKASRAALAAAMQGKYKAMHDALFGQEQRITDQSINDAAKAAGLDMTKFAADMNSQTVTDALDANRQLAEKLHLMGTPAFIIASTPNGTFKAGSEPSFVPGAASEESLMEMIKKAGSN